MRNPPKIALVIISAPRVTGLHNQKEESIGRTFATVVYYKRILRTTLVQVP